MKTRIILFIMMMCVSWMASATTLIDDTTTVYGKATPTATINGYYNICIGESADIPVYLSNATTYDITFTDGITQWTVTNVTSPYHIIVTPPVVRTYTIVSVIGDGCSGTGSGVATVIPMNAPTVYTLTCSNTSFCPGSLSGPLTLNGSVSSDIYYLRYVGDTMPISGTTMVGNGSIITFSGIGTAGTIECIAENSAGCQSVMSGNVTLTQNALPESATAINGPTSICANATDITYSIPTSIPNATSYVWSIPTGSTITTNYGSSIVVNIGNSTGNISVAGLNSCGSGPAFVLPITINPVPVITMTAPTTTICSGDNIDITATSSQYPSDFEWSTGQTGSTINTTPITTTTYVVTVTGSNTCSATADISIVVNSVPTPVINMPTSVCLQEHVPLSAYPTGGTWTGLGIGGDTLYTELPGPGTSLLTYSVTSNGCTGMDDHYIVINPLPYVTWTNIPGPFTTETPPLDLASYVDPMPGSGSGWMFEGPTGSFVGSVFDAKIAGAGTHQLIYTFTHLNGCSNDAGIYITINVVGIEDVDAVKDINIYPNPTSDHINLDGIDLKEIKELYIVNAIGQVVYITQPHSEHMTIQVYDLPAGNYSLVFGDGQDNFIGLKKFIKQ